MYKIVSNICVSSARNLTNMTLLAPSILRWQPDFRDLCISDLKHRLYIALGKGKMRPCTGTEALYRPYGL